MTAQSLRDNLRSDPTVAEAASGAWRSLPLKETPPLSSPEMGGKISPSHLRRGRGEVTAFPPLASQERGRGEVST